MLLRISIAADDLTGPKALKRPVGLRSGTPECPAERAGGDDRSLSESLTLLYSYEPRHFMTQDGSQSQWRSSTLQSDPAPKW